jgi:ubiquitin-small subunit ribosomal protein S27Ae
MSKKPAPAAAAKKDEAKPDAAAPAAKAPAGKTAEKPKAEKKTKKKGAGGVHVLYKVEGDKVTRARPTCERCGPGYFMADHHDRYTCGHCGFTRYKTK